LVEAESEDQCRRIRKAEIQQSVPPLELTPDVIAAAQAQDPALQMLYNVIREGGQQPAWSEVQSSAEETRVLWAQFASFKIENNVLYRQFHRADGSTSHMQIVMPASLRLAFLKQLHSSGSNVATTHLGIRKTQAHVQSRAYWPSWRSDVEKYCRRCELCQTVQHGVAPRHGKMRTYEANGAGDRLHIDLTGPHPSSRQGHVYIMTAIDAYTRFLVAVPLRNKTAVAVANALVDHVFLPFGSYRSIISDQGREFCNEVLEDVTRILGIDKMRTTAYRASANGRVERVHRTLNTLLSKTVSEHQRDWDERLPMVVAAYNAARHETTEYSPYYLMFGREYRTPLDLTLGVPELEPPEVCEYADQLRQRIQTAYEKVNERLCTKTQRMKIRYDAKVHGFRLSPGEYVLYYCPRRKLGRYQKWRRLCSVCRVEARFNDVLYSIRTSPRAKPILAHIDRLRRYEGDVPEAWKAAPTVRHPSQTVADNKHDNGEETDANDRNESPSLSPSAGQPTAEADGQLKSDEIVCAQTELSGTGVSTRPVEGPIEAQERVDTQAARGDNNTTVAEEPATASRASRPHRTRRPPARYRCVRVDPGHVTCLEDSHESVVCRERDNSNRVSEICLGKMSGNGNQRGARPRAADGSRLNRRQRERGPWQCPDCSRPPMADITTFRRHVVLYHNKHCSWSGHVRPFVDRAEADCFRGVISRAGRRSTVTNRCRSRQQETRQQPDLQASASLPSVRCLRQELPSVIATSGVNGMPGYTAATTEWQQGIADVPLSDLAEFDNLLQQLECPPTVDVSTMTIQTCSVGSQTDWSATSRRTTGVQTPPADPLHLPAGWDVRRLVQLALSEPLRSPQQLADSVSRQLDSPAPCVQYDNMVLVLTAQAETTRMVLEEVVRFQQQFQSLSNLGQPTDEFQLSFERWLNQLRQRAYGYCVPEPTSTDDSATTTSAAPRRSTAQTARRGRRPTGTSSTFRHPTNAAYAPSDAELM
jgi:hypothetical protein